MADVIEEADELRMKTLREILNRFKLWIILHTKRPTLCLVEYLAAAKKIRFCVQQWGEKRDQQHKE
ncbi:hypothetical protein H5410_007594 [Solanum commersonii]|uniref:Uncharacterized protein n=1 Tax=Solanum commersonii TaxID=4109 RepID=A0A9J6ACW1_SOLCO|nr:hypothetical protein H5410_007594 [Solanum commersonii]